MQFSVKTTINISVDVTKASTIHQQFLMQGIRLVFQENIFLIFEKDNSLHVSITDTYEVALLRVSLKGVKRNDIVMSRFVVFCVLAVAMLFVLQTTTSASAESTPACPVNETWFACGRMCERTCFLRNIYCRFVCNPREFSGAGACRCAQGYLREGENCILPQDCPPIERMRILNVNCVLNH
ncbi:uncharacterized protein LOC143423169 [Xylocopa sonorina]|uniref:uncharacterized protein LOC143423169 n=1 Tax=Xylocopa sonorina TaxID=1818115 RepID=UPI00403A919A